MSEEIEYRICSKCGERKELCKENYYWREKRKQWSTICKICRNQNRREYCKRNGENKEMPQGSKKCIVCGETKILCKDNFPLTRNHSNWDACCKLCKNTLSRERYRKKHPIKEKIDMAPSGFRYCNKCGDLKELNINNFYWLGDKKRFRTICISCIRIHSKQRYDNNIDRERERCKIQQREYRITHKVELKERRDKDIERRRARSRVYYRNNKNVVQEYRKRNAHKSRIYQNNYRRNKLKNNISFRIRICVSNNIRDYLVKHKLSKNGNSCLKYLPYTMEELKLYLESHFEFWMNWDNWGQYRVKEWDDNDPSTWKWQIDHIIPHSFFDYSSMEDEAFLKCWALENLRPYSAKQNLIDGNRRPIEKVAA